MPGERYVPLGLLVSGLLGDVRPAGQFLSAAEVQSLGYGVVSLRFLCAWRG